jgi:hypothetical protein
MFADMKVINYSWAKDVKKLVIALRKLEGLFRARAQGRNQKAVDDYFDLYRFRCTELNILDISALVFSVMWQGLVDGRWSYHSVCSKVLS